MIFDSHKPIFGNETNFVTKRNPPRVSIEGKWAHIRQFVEVLRRDGWKETHPVSGEPSGFKFTSVEFER